MRLKIHAPVRRLAKCNALQKKVVLMWKITGADQPCRSTTSARGPWFLRGRSFNNIPILRMMFVSFHSKSALNAEPGSPSSFTGGLPISMSRTLANGLRVPVNWLSGTERAIWSHVAAGVTGLWRAGLLLVGPSVPTNRVHCKAGHAGHPKAQSQAL